MSLFKELHHGFSHLLFPRFCEGCSDPLMQAEDILCLGCFQELPHTDYHLIPDNEAAMRLAGRIPYKHVTAMTQFIPDGLLQHLLHQLKYRQRKDIGIFLGRQLGRDLQKSDWAHDIDVIIPVPLHKKKEAKRGYNQSTLIATGVGEVLGKEVTTNILQRVKHTDSQVLKSREERVINVKDAFLINPQPGLHFKHALLIDDVLTTGATLEAAALCLSGIPDLQISIATIGMALG